MFFDFIFGENKFGFVEFETFPYWGIEFGANFDFEFVGEVTVVGQGDGSVIHVRFGDSGEVISVRDLLEAIHHEIAFDLVSDRFLEAGFEEFAGDLAVAKSGQFSARSDFVVSFLEVAINFRTGDSDDDVPFASG